MTPNLKKILLIVIVILVTSFGVLWYLGGQKTSQMTKTQMTEKEAAMRAFQLSTKQSQNIEKALVTSIEKASVEPSGTPIKFYQGTYSVTNLKLASNESTSTLTNYGLKLANILSLLNEAKGNGAEIMLKAIDNQDANLATQLATQAKIYKNTEIQLSSLAVPKSAAPMHVAILNSLHKINEMLLDMSQVLTNPQLAIKSGIIYQSNLTAFYQSLSNLNQYFSGKGITFRSQDQLTIFINSK